MNKIILVIHAFLALLVLGFGAPKTFAHTVAYKMGFAEGLYDKVHGQHFNPVDICNEDDQEGQNMNHRV